jgi:hypothetical protein
MHTNLLSWLAKPKLQGTRQERRLVRAVGIEPIQKSRAFIGKRGILNSSGSLRGSPRSDDDKILRHIVRIWPKLKKAQKEALLVLLQAFGKGVV